MKLNPLSRNTEVHYCTPMYRFITCRKTDDSQVRCKLTKCIWRKRIYSYVLGKKNTYRSGRRYSPQNGKTLVVLYKAESPGKVG